MKTMPMILGLLLLAATARAGKEGHGGSSVICRESNGALRSVEVLDLYEAREQYKLKLAAQAGTADEIAFRMLDRLMEASRRSFEDVPRYLGLVVSRKNVLASGVRVNKVNDVFPAIEPKTCAIEPLANYQPDGTVLIDGDYWQRLTPVQQAALYLHEAIYAQLRETEHASDSRKARRITAYLFSDKSDEEFTKWFRMTRGELPPPGEDLKLYVDLAGDGLVQNQEPTQAQRDQLNRSYLERCRAWRAEVRARMQPHAEFVYADCGERREGARSEAQGWTYRTWSTGTIHLRPNRGVLKMQERLRTDLYETTVFNPPLPGMAEEFRKRCDAWKESLAKRFGAALFYADCGRPEYNSHLANGAEAWDPQTRSRRRSFFGAELESRGFFVIFVDRPTTTSEGRLETKKYYFAPGDISGEANAFRWARYEFRQKCQELKARVENASVNIFVDCEISSEIQDHPYATSYTIIDNNYWMRGAYRIYEYDWRKELDRGN